MLPFPGKSLTAVVGLCALSLAVACGGAAETPAPAAGQTSAQTAAGQSAAPAAPAATEAPAAESRSPAPAATEVPVAAAVTAPTATPQVAEVMVDDKPVGTLTVGQKELGPFMGHPALTGNPQIFVLQTAPIGESLLTVSSDLETIPMLAKAGKYPKTVRRGPFHLNEGVQFHKATAK